MNQFFLFIQTKREGEAILPVPRPGTGDEGRQLRPGPRALPREHGAQLAASHDALQGKLVVSIFLRLNHDLIISFLSQI